MAPNKLADHRKLQTFALDKKLVDAFKQACIKQGTNMSAKVAELIRDFLRQGR